MAGDVAPYDVEALHDAVFGQCGAFTNRGCAPVACDDEAAAKIARTFERVGMNADHAIFFEDEIANRYAALELEAGEFRCFGDNHLEHRGLRRDAREADRYRRVGMAITRRGPQRVRRFETIDSVERRAVGEGRPRAAPRFPTASSISPRNSREKSICRSSSVTGTPRRASR